MTILWLILIPGSLLLWQNTEPKILLLVYFFLFVNAFSWLFDEMKLGNK